MALQSQKTTRLPVLQIQDTQHLKIHNWIIQLQFVWFVCMLREIYPAVGTPDFCMSNHPALPFLSVNTHVPVNMLSQKNVNTVMYCGEATSKPKEHVKYLLKPLPLQAWIGPYGSRMLRLPEFLDKVHMKVVTAVGPMHRSHLPPQQVMTSI